MQASMRVSVLLGVLAVVLLASAWFRFFEVYYVEAPELRFNKPILNPYDMAEKYLETSGVPVKTIGRLAEIDTLDTDGTLIIDDLDKVVGLRQQRKVIEWVSQGGHLIVQPSHSISDESLLGRLGLRWYRSPEREDADEGDDESNDESNVAANDENVTDLEADGAKTAEITDEKSGEQSVKQPDDFAEMLEAMAALQADDCECEPRIVSLAFEGTDDVLEVHFPTDEGFVHDAMYFDDDGNLAREMISIEFGDEFDTLFTEAYEPIYWVWHEDGAMFMQYDLGYGLVSVLPTMAIWRNAPILTGDHAYLLTVLAGDSSSVMILHQGEVDHLLVMIRKLAPELCITLALLLLFWLWRRSAVFGPRREGASTERAALNDHLQIEPLQLWRIGKLATMADAVESDLHHRMLLRGYPIGTMDSAAINQAIKHLTNTDPQAMLDELRAGKVSEKRLTHIVKALQILRNQL